MHLFYTLISILSFILTVRGWSIQPLENKQQHISRRLFTFVTIASPYCTLLSTPTCVQASDEPFTKTFVKGSITLKSDITLVAPEQRIDSALYITARPRQIDNVPKAILDGSNGKPPPVLAARISNPTFPLDFELGTADLTAEGLNGLSSDSTQIYWFEGNDLILSARWDTDGVAMTRDPTDLVGRSISKQQTEVSIELTGRGFTGKLVTGKSKK